MTPLLLAIIFLVVVGLLLWLPRLSDQEARGSLGASLVTGAVISLTFFFLQRADEDNAKKIANRQTLHVTIGLQRDLSRADLNSQNLSGFDLSKKDFSEADLHGATLTDATLLGTRLDRANLEEANLYGADLTDAWLEEATLSGADLQHAMMTRAHLKNAVIGEGADGKGTNLSHATLVDADLRGACLAFADLRYAVLGGTDLAGAVLTGADLRGAVLERDGIPVNLAGASVAGVKLDRDDRRFLGPTATPLPPDSSAPGAGTALSGAVPREAVRDRVTSVSDGDTLKLERLGWVRLIGLDAPPTEQAVGKEARDFLVREALLRKATVSYRLGKQQREPRAFNQVGRWRAYIWLADGRSLNELILQQGYAQRQVNELGRQEDAAYAPTLSEAEQSAKAAGRHIWATCPAK